MKTFFYVSAVFALVTLSACNCGKPPCSPGALSCPCNSDNSCNDGLICSDATCAAPTLAVVHVSDGAARGCEVVFAENTSTRFASASFKNGVEGQFVREAPKVGMSFVAGADKSINDGSVQVALVGDASGLSVVKASCVDAAGHRISGSTVTIQ